MSLCLSTTNKSKRKQLFKILLAEHRHETSLHDAEEEVVFNPRQRGRAMSCRYRLCTLCLRSLVGEPWLSPALVSESDFEGEVGPAVGQAGLEEYERRP